MRVRFEDGTRGGSKLEMPEWDKTARADGPT